MKEVGTSNWDNPNNYATNTSLFTALPGGYRDYEGYFYDVYKNGYWWSVTDDSLDPDLAWVRDIGYLNRDAYRYKKYRESGLSVRCLKDK